MCPDAEQGQEHAALLWPQLGWGHPRTKDAENWKGRWRLWGCSRSEGTERNDRETQGTGPDRTRVLGTADQRDPSAVSVGTFSLGGWTVLMGGVCVEICVRVCVHACM